MAGAPKPSACAAAQALAEQPSVSAARAGAALPAWKVSSTDAARSVAEPAAAYAQSLDAGAPLATRAGAAIPAVARKVHRATSRVARSRSPAARHQGAGARKAREGSQANPQTSAWASRTRFHWLTRRRAAVPAELRSLRSRRRAAVRDLWALRPTHRAAPRTGRRVPGARLQQFVAGLAEQDVRDRRRRRLPAKDAGEASAARCGA
jgi:hypothetical protein